MLTWGPDAVPKDTGKNYTLTGPFEVLKDLKDDFTLFSGMQCFSGSHSGPGAFLTGKNAPTNSFRLPSVDQQIAAFHHGKTRIPSLVLAIGRSTGLGGPFWYTPSWTPNRTPIAPENRPEAVFDRLFRVDDKTARDARDIKRVLDAGIEAVVDLAMLCEPRRPKIV